MAFFDRFAQVINETSHNALQRGREMTESAKMSSQIAAVQNELRRCYQGLGERYYEAFRQEEREELQPFVQQITSHLQQLEQLKEELRSLRGLVSCPNCGQDIPKNSVFCPNCGNRAITQDVSRCKACGAVAPAGTAFCIHCGGQMEFISGVNTAPKPQGSFCAQCGAPLEAGSQFCATCGASVGEAAQPSSAEGQNKPEVEEVYPEAPAWPMPSPEPSAAAEPRPFMEDEDMEQAVLLPEESEEQELEWVRTPLRYHSGENLMPEEAWEEPEVKPVSPVSHVCPQCGVTLEEDQVFCHNCGCRVEGGERR